jgi:hypothetical protein
VLVCEGLVYRMSIMLTFSTALILHHKFQYQMNRNTNSCIFSGSCPFKIFCLNTKLQITLENTSTHSQSSCMKTKGGSGCIDLHFLDLGTGWKQAVSFMPLLIYPKETVPSTHCIVGCVMLSDCVWLNLCKINMHMKRFHYIVTTLKIKVCFYNFCFGQFWTII